MRVSITQNPTKLKDCPFGPTDIGKGRKKNTCGKKKLMPQLGNEDLPACETRRSVEHCTPHADGAWLNEVGWSQ